MRLVTAYQMQRMDHNTIHSFGIPGRVLMETAGRGAVEMFVRKFGILTEKKPIRQKVGIIAGRGNNGGDGFVMGRCLVEKKIPTTIFLLSSRDKLTGDARANMRLAQKMIEHTPGSALIEIPDAAELARQTDCIAAQDFFVDAIFGIGLNADVRGFYKEVIELVNGSGKPVFSVDIPSGLNADTGAVCGVAIQAEATATFAFAKAGHILYPGNQYTGDLEIVDIGIPDFIARAEAPNLFLMEPREITPLFGPRKFESHKGSFGHLLVIAGSPGKTGAAALCANAAMRSGTGLVTLGVARDLNPILESLVTEPMTVPLAQTPEGCLSDQGLAAIQALLKDKQALALGPGIGTQAPTRTLVRQLISDTPVPIILDADGINCIAGHTELLKKRTRPTVLTPHPGEMARLTGKTAKEIQADRRKIGTQFAREYQVVLVLKGAQTLVCCPDGRTWICPAGNPGMASGGMGDVLTGLIAGFAAQGFAVEDSAMAGVFIHGCCGDSLAVKTPFGFLASDMISAIPKTIHALVK
jgi:ADP-dependent NAD(P)H-hydrate dehydratase / NAD(P)H-hydrate epimerase